MKRTSFLGVGSKRFVILYKRQCDQDHPQGKEMQKGKWLSEEALQITVKRSKKQRRKGKIYLFDVEFQRLARRDKKAFLSNQCKRMEENNRMGKTRDFFPR